MLIIIVTDSQWFILKSKSVIYIEVFIKIYNWRNRKQVHKIPLIIELQKKCALIEKNLHNLGANQMMKILLVLHSIYMISRD